jgi:pseudouridine-5'-phosphate glycosidase
MMIALESALITHGLPRPLNIEVALQLQAVAEDHGCQAKTIGIIGGEIRVGLSEDDMKLLAEQRDIVKAGVREIPLVVAQKLWASTTVSATARIANLNGIHAFATGGIGGVHPGRWDVSQDIIELSRTRIVVVSSGPKSILDLQATYEMLETFGVTVVGFRTEEMPAFYSRSSGIALPRVHDTDEIADIYRSLESLGLPGAVLVFNPIPGEYEIANAEFEEWLRRSVADLTATGVSGKDVTPFLLRKLAEYSGGRTVASNVELLKANVRLACEIAISLRESRDAA